MSNALRGLRAAFVFLTRLPVGGFPYSPEEWRWAPAWFPLVGGVIGLASASTAWLFSHIVDPVVSAIFAITASILLTGAFHEDGLADTADALGGAHGQKRILEILKDSRVGTYGAIALTLSLLVRVACLSSLYAALFPALILSHTLARTGPVWMIATMRYVTESGAKGTLVGTATKRQAFIATLWASLTLAFTTWCFALGLEEIATTVLLVTSTTLAAAYIFKKRTGGITGDFLGATEQLSEVAVLVVLLAFTD